MTDIDNLLNDLHDLRADFGAIEDDYRQSRIDVAITQLKECKDVKNDYQNAGLWRAGDSES